MCIINKIYFMKGELFKRSYNFRKKKRRINGRERKRGLFDVEFEDGLEFRDE